MHFLVSACSNEWSFQIKKQISVDYDNNNNTIILEMHIW